MKHRWFALCCALLVCLLLCSACSAEQIKQDLGDTRGPALLSALRSGDVETLYSLFHPAVDHGSFEQDAALLLAELPEGGEWSLKRFQVHVDITNGVKQIQEGFFLECGDRRFTVSTVYREDDRGKGYIALNLNDPAVQAEENRQTGTFASWRENNLTQKLLLILWLACLAFAGYTAVDILRRKPRLYGLWLAGLVLFLYLSVSMGKSSFHLNVVMAGILTQTHLLRWPDGSTELVLSLPIVAVIYWIVRKKLAPARGVRSAYPTSGGLAQPTAASAAASGGLAQPTAAPAAASGSLARPTAAPAAASGSLAQPASPAQFTEEAAPSSGPADRPPAWVEPVPGTGDFTADPEHSAPAAEDEAFDTGTSEKEWDV